MRGAPGLVEVLLLRAYLICGYVFTLSRWFAPDNVEVPLREIDARPGGVIRFQHRWPERQLVSIRGVFDEIVAPTRLSFTFRLVDSNDRPTVAAIGWSQTAERLVAYLERRTPWDS